MQAIVVALVKSGSFRRILALFAGMVVAWANKKFGLGLDATEITGVLATVATYIVTSNWKEARVTEAEANTPPPVTISSVSPARIDTLEEAVQELRKRHPPGPTP